MGKRIKDRIDNLPEEQRKRLIKMHADGYPLRRIGERFGIDCTAISRFLRRVKAYETDKVGKTSWG